MTPPVPQPTAFPNPAADHVTHLAAYLGAERVTYRPTHTSTTTDPTPPPIASATMQQGNVQEREARLAGRHAAQQAVARHKWTRQETPVSPCVCV